MQRPETDFYATLGLDQKCTIEQIRAAYRVLARRYHPDVNPDSKDAHARTQELNAAYETLRKPESRRVYDESLKARREPTEKPKRARVERNVSQDVPLRIDELFKGTELEVRVNDPGNPNGAETYRLDVPSDTGPGTRFKIPRTAPFENGFVNVRIKVRPDYRFKVRGSDLRCDLRIPAERVVRGGQETITGPTGKRLSIAIQPGVARGDEVRIKREGLPKSNGGRGDLIVRITYRLAVRITRAGRV